MCHHCSTSVIRRNLFNQDGSRRYLAQRMWDSNRPSLFVVLANPAKLDSTGDNPTTRAVMAIACRNGFGSVDIANLDPRLSVQPLRDGPIEDQENQRLLDAGLAGSATIWCAWGATIGLMPGAHGRIEALLSRAADKLVSIGQTRAGHPAHPARKSHSLHLSTFPIPN